MAGQPSSEHETYYVPEQSKLALMASIGLFLAVFGAASVLNDISFGKSMGGGLSVPILVLGLFFFIATLFVWFRITIIENRQGLNSAQLKRSYVIGMQWFIFSEVMFFLAFFGALFYVRTLAGPWLAGEGDGASNQLLWEGFQYSWPMMETPQQAVGGVAGQAMANTGIFEGPEKTFAFPGWSNLFTWLPLWNTLILLSSSFTVHVAHVALKEGNRKKLNTWLLITVLLAAVFLCVQAYEYYEAYAVYGLTLQTGIYGSTFFMLTGFHGVHVLMGATMLLIQLLRSRAGHFTPDDHFGFEASAWYWHFVDVVWVGLFLFVYVM